MTISFDPDAARELLAAPKMVIPVKKWIPRYNAAGQEEGRKITGIFSGRHPMIGRLFLNISISGGTKTTMQVSLSSLGMRTRLPLYRIDLAPGRHHTNLLRDGDPDSGRRFGPFDNHIHDFEDAMPGARLDDFGRPAPQSIVDFRSAIQHLCIRINVDNPNDIPDPEAQGSLL